VRELLGLPDLLGGGLRARQPANSGGFRRFQRRSIAGKQRRNLWELGGNELRIIRLDRRDDLRGVAVHLDGGGHPGWDVGTVIERLYGLCDKLDRRRHVADSR
jgi:hypothetical protein